MSGGDRISQELFSTLEDFELVLIEKPGGVTSSEVFNLSGQKIKKSCWAARVSKLVARGLLVMHGGIRDKGTYYTLPPDFSEKKANLRIERTFVHPREPQAVSSPVHLAVARHDSDYQGLPKLNLAELRKNVATLIDALEKFQAHLPSTLALLLDLERDFERYERIKEVLSGMKRLADTPI